MMVVSPLGITSLPHLPQISLYLRRNQKKKKNNCDAAVSQLTSKSPSEHSRHVRDDVLLRTLLLLDTLGVVLLAADDGGLAAGLNLLLAHRADLFVTVHNRQTATEVRKCESQGDSGKCHHRKSKPRKRTK